MTTLPTVPAASPIPLADADSPNSGAAPAGENGYRRNISAGFMLRQTDAQFVFEMDGADFSHDPSYLPSFLSRESPIAMW